MPENLNQDQNRDLERRLRRALAGEATSVHPSDGLARIRAAIATDSAATTPVRRRLWRLPNLPRLGVPLAAAAAILALAVITPMLFRLAGPTPAPPAGEDPSVVASGVERIEPLPVYFITLGNDGWALTREFEPTALTDPAERLRAALRIAVAGAAARRWCSPDRRRLGVPAASGPDDPPVDATASVDGLTVTLGATLTQLDAPVSTRMVASQAAQLAVDQLVWTATAVAGRAVPVAINLQGTPPMPGGPSLFGVLLNTPFERTIGDADPRLPIWISSLREGDALSSGTATITGDSARVEAPPIWSLYRDDGVGFEQVPTASGTTQWVRDESAPTSARREWQVTIPLGEPGTYSLRVDLNGYTDDKQFTVR